MFGNHDQPLHEAIHKFQPIGKRTGLGGNPWRHGGKGAVGAGGTATAGAQQRCADMTREPQSSRETNLTPEGERLHRTVGQPHWEQLQGKPNRWFVGG